MRFLAKRVDQQPALEILNQLFERDSLGWNAYLIEGRRLMHNDFVIVGPESDPAGARGKPLEESLRAIARHGAFVSRGDDSGTHMRELAIWELAGVDPALRVPRAESP